MAFLFLPDHAVPGGCFFNGQGRLNLNPAKDVMLIYRHGNHKLGFIACLASRQAVKKAGYGWSPINR